jgi:hypothetical protein
VDCGAVAVLTPGVPEPLFIDDVAVTQAEFADEGALVGLGEDCTPVWIREEGTVFGSVVADCDAFTVDKARSRAMIGSPEGILSVGEDYVADVDDDRVTALDVEAGDERWRVDVGDRVVSIEAFGTDGVAVLAHNGTGGLLTFLDSDGDVIYSGYSPAIPDPAALTVSAAGDAIAITFPNETHLFTFE